MGLLSLLKNLNLGFGMPHVPTTTSAGTMQTKEFEGLEQTNKMPLAGDHHEITGVDKGTIIKSDETESCTFGMDRTFNHPSRKDNVEEKLEEAISGQRRLVKLKGVQGHGNIASSEKAGQFECKFYLLPGGCKYGNDCRFFHDVQVNFLGLPIRPGGQECPIYMRTGGCESASRCRFHHPDPTAVVGDILQDRKNGVPSQHQGPVEQLYGTPRPSEDTSNEQTAFLGPFTPNRGIQQNVYWIGNPTTSPMHPQEMNINDQRKTVPNKDVKYGLSGAELQQFEEYPQRPSEPECQHFMKTRYCKFKSACRYHHPKSNVSFFGLPEGLASDNYQHRGPIEQMSATTLPSENCSNGQTAFSGPSSSVPDLFPPNQGLKPNAQANENQIATSPLDPPEIKIDEKGQELANKNTADIFNGCAKSQQFDEYPQRPSESECQHFMKTGYCKFKSACRFHHPKPRLSFQAPPVKPMATSPLNPPPPEIKKNEKDQELATKDTVQEFNGGVKSQQFVDYPQRPSEPERQQMKTGSCKAKSACRSHHPKSNLSVPAQPRKSMATSQLNPSPSEIKKNEKDQDLATKDTVQEFNGGVKSQQFVDYPQRPSELERQQMKTGSCKAKPACKSHHPKSNLSVPAQPRKSMATSPLNPPPPEIKKNEKDQELATKDTVQEFNGGVKSQQFVDCPQRPSEPERQQVKTGSCKAKSACRSHHPKSNQSVPAQSRKSDKQSICTHYSQSGNCKFGSACRFSHHIEHTQTHSAIAPS